MSALPSLDPFGLRPSVTGLDHFTAYWICALINAGYAGNDADKLSLGSLAGALSVERARIPALVVPDADVYEFPGLRAVVVTNGSTNFVQLAFQAAGAPLVSRGEWSGTVGQGWSTLALDLFPQIASQLSIFGSEEVAFYGHSLGGGLTQLFPGLVEPIVDLDVPCIATIGCPRTGDVVYAESQTVENLRITNAGDPVTLLPAATSTPLDLFLWIIPPINLNSYSHWGTRFNVFPDGSATNPPELPTWTSAQQLLYDSIFVQSDWLQSHSVAEYARRLRLSLPQPVGGAHPNYPGLQTIDEYFEQQPITPAADQWFVPVYCA